MIRLAALSFALAAAFDLALPWLDRLGTLALAVAMLALASPRLRVERREMEADPLAEMRAARPDDLPPGMSEAFDRIERMTAAADR